MYTKEDAFNALQFWKRFSEKRLAYEFLDDMEETQREETLYDIEEMLVDFVPVVDAIVRRGRSGDDNSFEIIITTNNHPEHFHWAEYLVGLAPEIPGWSVVYLCPPYANKEKVLEGLKNWGISPRDITCYLKVPYEGFGFTNINILVNDWDLGRLSKPEHTILTDLMRQMVSDLIGEEAFGLYIKDIVFGSTTTDLQAQGFYPILELPQRFPKFKQDMAGFAGF